MDATLRDALQDSLHLTGSSPLSNLASSPEIAAAVSQGIDVASRMPAQTSPFAAPGASEAAFGDLSKPEADKTIAANLRQTLNRLNTLSLPVALVTAKSDALPSDVEVSLGAYSQRK